MAYFDQAHFDIRCEWGSAGLTHLAHGEVVVIIDVLSFSTAVDIALDRGATILPYQWDDECVLEYADANAALVASRDRSSSNYSLSPKSLLDVPPGSRLVLPSPNGSSLCFQARDRGSAVIAGSLRNAKSVAEWAQKAAKPINIIPCGEKWEDGSLRPAIEDLIGAGAILSQLRGSKSPESEIAIAAFESARSDLGSIIRNSASGRELIERGFEQDVDLASQLNVSSTVPKLELNAFANASRE